MAFFSEYNRDLCISISDSLNNEILHFLLRKDGQEDLLFGSWYPSEGSERDTALIQSFLPPEKGDRKVHGNVSFNYQYFKRACEQAIKKNCGLVFMHSHPFPGWQSMSPDDINAESRMAPTVDTITNLPLLGLTVGSDGTWSGRIWQYYDSYYQKKWAKSVKIIGRKFCIYLNNKQKYRFLKSEYLKRTISVWGRSNQEMFSNLTIAVVGLGSVGSIVAETLSRIGIRKIILIDFDKVEKHNLDRIIGTTKNDIGKYKVNVIAEAIKKSTPLNKIEVTAIKENIASKEAYLKALDCDFIFCCADKPRARYILNHIAYSHLIPVINGGILAEVVDAKLQFADWELSLIAPNRPCMHCLEAYKSSDVILEVEGKLEDPEYIKGLIKDSLYRQNQNIIPFSMNLASLEVLQFIAYATGTANFDYYGVQRYRFRQAVLSNYIDKKCNNHCDFSKNIAFGDHHICPIEI
jgi:molybdopterin/thiamine biosynthesis adenylyltransferase